MYKKYTQTEAEETVKNISNNEFVLNGRYKGSREYHEFKHLKCGKISKKRWANFIDAYRQGSKEYKCIHCKI